MLSHVQWKIVLGDCIDGKQAMEAIERLQPDVVLTDINMPFVAGLQLTRFIMERNFQNP